MSRRLRAPLKKVPKGWVGFDFDGTLGFYDGWKGPDHQGAPIEPMVALLKELLAIGVECRIMTARWCDVDRRKHIQKAMDAWCAIHVGQTLAITNEKDYSMIAIIDDRAIAVEKNTGRILGGDLWALLGLHKDTKEES